MHQIIAAAVAAVLAGALVACGSPATDIADVSIVTVLPKEVGPGGFTRTISGDGVASGFFFKATLSDCSSAIDSVGRAWAAEYGLVGTRRTVESERATLGFTSDRFPDGAFVIAYRVTSARDHALIRVTYEATSGRRTLSADELGGVGVVALIDNLVAAGRCDAGG